MRTYYVGQGTLRHCDNLDRKEDKRERVYVYAWPIPTRMGFPCGSAGNESVCNAEDLGSIPGLGRSPREGKDYPVQYSGLENSMDRGDWQATVHKVSKSQAQPSK